MLITCAVEQIGSSRPIRDEENRTRRGPNRAAVNFGHVATILRNPPRSDAGLDRIGRRGECTVDKSEEPIFFKHANQSLVVLLVSAP